MPSETVVHEPQSLKGCSSFDPDDCGGMSPGKPPPILYCIVSSIERGRADCRTTQRAMNACTMLEAKTHQRAVGVSQKNWKRTESIPPRPSMLPIFMALGGVASSVCERLSRLIRPARTGFNPVRPAYCETFSGSGRRGTPGLHGADGDAEYRPPKV